MEFKLFNLLSFWGCAHDFAWPRSKGDGGHTQICRLCGAEYEYDWLHMRRKKRIMKPCLESKVPVHSNSRTLNPVP